jgi:GH43 family beta-xylosidase
MSGKVLTVREVLNVENFDPMNIDISEFEELAKSMPRDGSFDLQTAEALAAQSLRAADRCSEILSTLIWFEGKAKSNKNAIRSRLYLVAKDEGYKTVEERKAYAESHNDYTSADDNLATVYAARKYFEMRYDFFLKSHQYMKERLREEWKGQASSKFSGSGQAAYGEGSWE